MKLIYILNSYSATDSSHFTHILHLLEIMALQGCQIALVIEKAHGLPRFDNPNIQVFSLRQSLPGLRHLALFAQILKLVKQGYRTTFIRIAAPAAIIAAIAHRAIGGRVFLWQSGTTHEHDRAQPLSIEKMKWFVASCLPNWVARKLVHRFVTGPEAMVDYYADVVGIRRDKIVLLYNDIQIERFAADVAPGAGQTFRASLGLPCDATILLLVHRLSPVRRTLMYLKPLLEALASNCPERNWSLVIAGGGSELEAAKSLARNLGVAGQVIFLGNVANREIPALYAAADIFVNPTYTEGFPRVVIEAMASGLPIVTTDAGGTRQLLGPQQSAYVTDKSHADEFAKKTIQLLQRQDNWDSLIHENRRVVERFATPAVAQMYLKELFA
jgi:glycosyltransferase involved in cell wall biosynthesis